MIFDRGERSLHVLGTAIGPAHTIIGGPDGSDVYSDGNGSITGNGPHNPFLAGTVTFDLSVLGLTDASTITEALFSFGTTEGTFVTGTCRDCTPPPLVPEPSTGWIFVISGVLAAIATAMLRRREMAGQRA